MILRKILAYPAFLSSKIAGAVYPRFYEASEWDGTFNLDCMYRRGYIFGAVIWALLLVGVAVLAL